MHRLCHQLPPFYRVLVVMTCLFYATQGLAQQKWPRLIRSAKGDIIQLYQPQPESFNNDQLNVRAAVSVVPKGRTEPVFGAIWVHASMATDRETRLVTLQKVQVTDLRFPGQNDSTVIDSLKRLLEQEIPKWDISIPLDELLASLEEQTNRSGADQLSTNPPKIIYRNKPSMLVLIDGEPQFKEHKDLKVEVVVNTVFIIVRNKNKKFYLFGGGRWFQSQAMGGPWAVAKSLPSQVKEIDKKITNRPDSVSKVVPEIIMSTEPAELIQTNGETDLLPISGTHLLYVTNTNNDIFLFIDSQQYFLLLSGRWYTAAALTGPWKWVASDKLPPDFAKIPESSAKGSVLASVAGTDAAREAVLDAQVPQTAKVDRKKATTTVKYDGKPDFKPIEGTDMQYAANTSSSVVQSDKRYYCVDNGVWFEADDPNGPWKVATSRPDEVDKIPPSNPVYNVKYVYVYDVTPEYVYMGYTPGYVGTYVYGPTVVYGTGMYYNPWYGPYYYPRPATFGFSMHYNPYTGWGFGMHFSTGWFNMSFYGGGYGGCWGPPMYRPPYYHPPHYPPAYRPPAYPPSGYRPPATSGGTPSQQPAGSRPSTGRQPSVSNPIANNGSGSNLYKNHKGVSSNDRQRPATGARPSQQPTAGNRLPSASTRPANNVLTDKQGNVYQRNGNQWQQREGNSWQQVNNNRQADINSLNKQQQMRDRGSSRTQQFNQYNRSSSRPSPSMRSGGGGRRR